MAAPVRDHGEVHMRPRPAAARVWFALLISVELGCGASSRTVGEDYAEPSAEAGAGGADGSSLSGAGGAAGESHGAEAGDASDPSAGAAGAMPVACTDGVVPTSQIPRLTNEQYDRTVRDLLGVSALTTFDGAVASSILAPYHTGALTDLDFRAYVTVAQAVATQVMSDAALRANFMACIPEGDGSACLHDTIVTFGRRAFRRPLTAAEIARFDALVAMGPEITESGRPEEVAEVILNTFLVSPSFLLRTELTQTPGENGTFVLSPHELASRLSYTLWGSLPDSELDAAADSGALATKEQILSQATRMLVDPRARDMVRRFHRYYVGMGPGSRWASVSKDPDSFPEFTDAVVRAMTEATERFFEELVLDRGGTLPDLFSSPLAFVNADTAPLYGLDPAAFDGELRAVELDPALRPGFLTRVGFLSANSHWDRASPVLRGAVILRNVLGVEVGASTPSAVATPLPDAADLLTNRERVEAQTGDPACSGCHAYLNPLGYALEGFDAAGRHQTTDPGSGAPIDTAAEVFVDGEARPVADAAELMQTIAASEDARREYARKWFSFAHERAIDERDGCALEELTLKLTDDGYRIVDLFADLTQTDSFRLRAREDTP
jgi:hypothetical protein